MRLRHIIMLIFTALALAVYAFVYAGQFQGDVDSNQALDTRFGGTNKDSRTWTGYVVTRDGNWSVSTIDHNATDDNRTPTTSYVNQLVGASVSDVAYSSSWDGNSTVAPSKNVVYDVISSMTGVSPEAYGAVCDNATDDSASFAAAITASPPGGRLILPCNKICVSNLEIDKSLTIQGCSPRNYGYTENAGLRPYTASSPVIKVANNSIPVSVSIRDTAIWGNNKTDYYGVQFGPGSSGSSLINSAVYGFMKAQVFIGDDSDMANWISDINFEKVFLSTNGDRGHGIKIKNGSTGTGANNWITGIRVNQSWIQAAASTYTWTAGHAYVAGESVRATDDRLPDDTLTTDWGWIFYTDSNCTSDSTEPVTWYTGDGNTTIDNDCTWVAQQRGRAIWLEGGQIDLDTVYIDAQNFKGIRWERGSPLTNAVNVNLDDGGVGGVVLEDRIRDGTGPWWLSGSVYIPTGRFKPKNRASYVPSGTSFQSYLQPLYEPMIMGGRSSLGMYFIPDETQYSGYNPNNNRIGYVAATDNSTFTVSAYDNSTAYLDLNSLALASNVRIGGASGGTWDTAHLQIGGSHLYGDNVTNELRIKSSSPTSNISGEKVITLHDVFTYPDAVTWEIYGDNISSSFSITSGNTPVKNTSETFGSTSFNHYFTSNYDITGDIYTSRFYTFNYGTGDRSYLRGSTSGIYNYGKDSTITLGIGANFIVNNSDNGTISSAYGVLSQIVNGEDGTITEASGVRVFNAYNPGPGVIGTLYGVYISEQTTGSTNYGLYAEGPNNYLGGNTTLVTALKDASHIFVTGPASPAAGYLTKWDSSGVHIVDGPSATVPSFTSITTAGTTGGYKRTFSEATATLSGASTTIQVNIPATSRILGCQLRVDVLITSAAATSWDVEFSGGSSLPLASGQPFTKNTKVNSLASDVVTAETDLLVTPNTGTFTGGEVRAICYYDTFVAMGDAP